MRGGKKRLNLLRWPMVNALGLLGLSGVLGSADAGSRPARQRFGPLMPLASVRLVHEGGEGVLEWETTAEVGTAGFYVYRLEPDQGGWSLLNTEILPAFIDAPQGAVYRFHDEGAAPDRAHVYALLEVEADGGVNVHGPFHLEASASIGSDESPTLFERRLKMPSSQMLGSRHSEQARNRERHVRREASKTRFSGACCSPCDGPPRAAKIAVRDTGLYYVDATRIAQALGTPLIETMGRIGRRSLSLTHLEEEIAWLPADGNQGLYFYGEAIDSPFTSENIYRVKPRKGVLIPQVPARPSTCPPAEASFEERLHFEQDIFGGTVVSTDPDSDFWYWAVLFAGDRTLGTQQFDFKLSGVASTEVEAGIVLEMFGATETGVPREHHVEVRINGILVGESWWEGRGRRELALSFPHHVLKEGANVLELTAVLDPGVGYSIYYLDGFVVRYRRVFRAESDQLLCSGQKPVVEVTGFTETDIRVLEVSEPKVPVLLTETKVTPSMDGFSVAFAARADARYFTVGPAAILTPESVWAETCSRLKCRSNHADYLVITPAELEDAAEALAAYRRSRGHRTMVVGLEEIMDAFNGGIESPLAVRSFLAYAYKNWKCKPRYVVLAGKGSVDYKNVLGLGGNLVPPLLASTPYGLYASDNRFVDVVGDDGVPEMAIGRIPAVTAEEILDYVEKVRAYESAVPDEWMTRVLMVADAPQPGANFAADSENLAALVPAPYQVERIYLSPELPTPVARSRLLERLNQGLLHLNYMGDAGLHQFASPPLLHITDVEGLGNGVKLPVVTALTSWVARFEAPGFESLAEALVKKTGGGAIAVVGPTGIADEPDVALLGEGFFQAAFQDGKGRVGDLARAAFRELHDKGGSRFAIDIYYLLGDPGLRMHGPPSSKPPCGRGRF